MKSPIVILFTALIVFCPTPIQAQKRAEMKTRVLELVAQSDDLVYDNPSRSLSLSLQANGLAKELKDDSLVALTLNRIGSAHWSLGNGIQALQYLQESLQMAEAKKLEHLLAKNYGNIGNVYSAAGLDLDAIGFYRLELSIQRKLNTPFRLFVINNNIGKAFLDIDFYDSAQYYLGNAAKYFDDSFIHLHSVFYFNQAETFFGQQQWEKADSLLKITLENAEAFNSKRGIIRANQLQAELDLIYGNPEKALKHAKKAAALAKESKVKELIYITSKTLSNCYASLKNYELAFKYDQEYEAYQDSVKSVSIVNELELLTYYQRLFRMRVLQEKSTLNRQVADQRKFIIYGLMGVLLIAVFMISIIVRRGRKINSQAQKLEELNAFKNKIFAIISHDLKSPIQAVSSAIEMLHEKLITKEEIETHLPEIQRKTATLMDLLNNIFQWAEGQMDGGMFLKEEFLLVDVIKDLENELGERLEKKEITLTYKKDTELKLNSNPGIVRIVLRNLIVNAIKFSERNTEIVIDYVKQGDECIIQVIDQGIGMSEDRLSGLFRMEVGSSDGTEGEKGNGLGLALCMDFVRGLGGSMEAHSKPGEGSTFRVAFKA